MRVRTLLVATLALLGLTWAATPAGLPDYDELKAEAEALYADGSYALAQRLYEEADALELDAFESRWVDFRLADIGPRGASVHPAGLPLRGSQKTRPASSVVGDEE